MTVRCANKGELLLLHEIIPLTALVEKKDVRRTITTDSMVVA
jgi:hypothetical protein